MSDTGFDELQRLWQATPAAVASAQQIILRQRQRRWLSRFYLWSEIVATVAGIPIAIWMALQPRGLVPGIGLLVLVFFAASASLWARSAPPVRAEEPLLASIEQGVRRARIGVRLGYAGFWGVIASLLFVGAISFTWMSASDLSLQTARRIITALIIWCVWFALMLAVLVPYLAHRTRELAQLENFRKAMDSLD